MKLFLQKLLEKDSEWDKKISDEEMKRWTEKIGGLVYFTDIRIPKFACNNPAQLFCFCDGSGKVYTTAIYISNITDGTGNLLFSKAQNSPKIKMLIKPRLKLLSVLIGVRSPQFVTKTLKIEVTERVL